jgi:hypothetical protein
MRFTLLAVAIAACAEHGTTVTCDHEVLLRDPSTGLCQSFTCGSQTPDWSVCGNACEQLSEGQCRATSGCHAAYIDHATEQSAGFWSCWGVAPSGPIEGNCTGLDAQECSRYDDCTSIYYPNVPSTDTTPQIPPSFEGCAPSIGSCANVDCGPGDYWVSQPPSTQCICVAHISTGTCPGQPTCGSGPPSCPPGSSPGVLNGCFTPYCILDFQCT